VKVCHPWTLDSGIPAGMTAIWSLAGLHAIALGWHGLSHGQAEYHALPSKVKAGKQLTHSEQT